MEGFLIFLFCTLYTLAVVGFTYAVIKRKEISKKKRNNAIVFSLLSLVLSIVCFYVFGNSMGNDDVSYTKEDLIVEDAETTPPTEAPIIENHKVGDSVMFTNGLEVTIESISDSSETPNGNISGNFVEVSFTIDNQSESDKNFNAHGFELYDSDRNKAERNSKDYYSEDIAKGMKSSGKVYFDSKEKGPYSVKVGDTIWESN